MAADLHCHTKLSDGSVGIEDLIVIAQKSGIDTIAITDHDCLAGTVRGQVIGKRYGVTVVLKGKGTLISDKAGNVRINSTGNCGMATGGTGDVLAGVIASFAGQGLEAFDAAVLGTYIHGKAGDLVRLQKGVHGMIAGDVADMLPVAIKTEIE